MTPTDEIFFVAGGTLKASTPSYVERPADAELFEAVMDGQLCYVLTPRQMGKSSLMTRTSRKLQAQGIRTASIDLTSIGTQVTAQQWYTSIISQLNRQLNLGIDAQEWCKQQEGLAYIQTFSTFLEEIMLEKIAERVVIFIDEIDSTLSLNFRDDFFAGLRAIYNARTDKPGFERIAFVLLGVASPSDLIADKARTPFNIGRAIALQEFDFAHAHVLQTGLDAVYPAQGEPILQRIFHWTNGHPYLTQKLCSEIVERKGETWDDAAIDQLVHELFLSEQARKETNLQFVQDRLLQNPKRQSLLHLYRNILSGRVLDDRQSILQNELKLSGLVHVNNKSVLIVRNQIYKTVFNLEWVTSFSEVSFVVGGTLKANALSYVNRPADDELFDAVSSGSFCYVLATRQMGKSSLMVRTRKRLKEQDIFTVIIDLTSIGTQVSIDEWYMMILSMISRQLNFDLDIKEWFHEHSDLKNSQFLSSFFEEIVIKKITRPIVIFIDEIDSMLGLVFRDNFFEDVYSIYNARIDKPEFKKVSFVLLGVTFLAELNADRVHTLFSIGHHISLQEIEFVDAQVFRDGLEIVYPNDGRKILKRIFYWTNGHPYLTQKICLNIVEQKQNKETWDDKDIDQLVDGLFLSPQSKDGNLQFIQSRLKDSPQRAALLSLYKRILRGEVREEAQSALQNELKISGLVRAEDNILKVRNRIYATVFNLAWIQANTPTIWSIRTSVLLIVTALILISWLLVIPGRFLYNEILRQQVVDSSPIVALQGGIIVFGTNDTNRSPEEPLLQKVAVASFAIETFEVTNRKYHICVDVGVCEKPDDTTFYDNPAYDNHPVVYVTLNQANAYCAWLGRQLPTTFEWERAARGTQGRMWPWGETPISKDVANVIIEPQSANEDWYLPTDTLPVGSLKAGATKDGIYDLVGNVWEWTTSAVDKDKGKFYILRGASWQTQPTRVTTSFFAINAPFSDVGFRCIQ